MTQKSVWLSQQDFKNALKTVNPHVYFHKERKEKSKVR